MIRIVSITRLNFHYTELMNSLEIRDLEILIGYIRSQHLLLSRGLILVCNIQSRSVKDHIFLHLQQRSSFCAQNSTANRQSILQRWSSLQTRPTSDNLDRGSIYKSKLLLIKRKRMGREGSGRVRTPLCSITIASNLNLWYGIYTASRQTPCLAQTSSLYCIRRSALYYAIVCSTDRQTCGQNGGHRSVLRELIAHAMLSVPCLLAPYGYLITREVDGVQNDKERRCILWNPTLYDGLSQKQYHVPDESSKVPSYFISARPTIHLCQCPNVLLSLKVSRLHM